MSHIHECSTPDSLQRSEMNGNTRSSVQTNPKRPLSHSSSVDSMMPELKKVNYDDCLSEIELNLDESLWSTYDLIDRNFNGVVMECLQSENIKSFLTQMFSEIIETRMNVIIQEKMRDYQDRISFLQGCVDTLTISVHELETSLDERDQKIRMLERAADHQEQYSRRHSLRISNPWPEQRDENTDQMVVNMAKDLLDMDIKQNEIDRSHRVGKPKGTNKPRPVIIKFVSYKTKDKIYSNRNRLAMAGDKSKQVFINEDLTRTRASMYKRARKLKSEQQIVDCWTNDGNIFIRDFSGKTRVFTHPHELDRFVAMIYAKPHRSYSRVVEGRPAVAPGDNEHFSVLP